MALQANTYGDTIKGEDNLKIRVRYLSVKRNHEIKGTAADETRQEESTEQVAQAHAKMHAPRTARLQERQDHCILHRHGVREGGVLDTPNRLIPMCQKSVDQLPVGQ